MAGGKSAIGRFDSTLDTVGEEIRALEERLCERGFSGETEPTVDTDAQKEMCHWRGSPTSAICKQKTQRDAGASSSVKA